MIHAICQWCVASAIVMTALAGVSIAYFLAGERDRLHDAPCGHSRMKPAA